jgi:adenylate cyclase
VDSLSQYLRRLRAGAGQAVRSLGTLRLVQAAAPVISRLAEAGIEGYPAETKRRLMILNMIAYLIAISTLIYALQHAFLDYSKYRPVVLINLALVATMLVVPFMHRFGDVAGAMLIAVSELVALICFAALLGRSSGVQLQYFVFAAAAFVVFGLKRLWLIVPTVGVALLLHLASWFWFPRSNAIIHAEREVIDSIYIQAAITTFGLIAATVYYAFRLAENARAETDALLRNILPDSIVERLKLRPAEPIADSFAEASVLFADISGFVPLARRLGARRTVELLNNMVTEFDALSVRHGVEKIKTIGDAYMVAAGVPEWLPDHLSRLACLALDMQSVVGRLREDTGLDLNIRIGLATGPIMAGVIGRQKFSYDVWGDAVNLAARLENLSAPGRIHVCPRCRVELARDFVLESRGMVEIKGVGQQETWFLIGVRDRNASAEIAAE